MFGGGLSALGDDVDAFYNGAVLIGIDRENAALAALILACENVNGIALLI